jgi:putative membrane protein
MVPSPVQRPTAQRDHLANVRTLLAWVRTAMTIMGFGFVVAKFGLLVDELPGRPSHTHHSPLATVIGTLLVLLGAVLLGVATREFLLVRRAIDAGVVASGTRIYVALSAALMIVAVVLAGYLLVTA